MLGNANANANANANNAGKWQFSILVGFCTRASFTPSSWSPTLLQPSCPAQKSPPFVPSLLFLSTLSSGAQWIEPDSSIDPSEQSTGQAGVTSPHTHY